MLNYNFNSPIISPISAPISTPLLGSSSTFNPTPSFNPTPHLGSSPSFATPSIIPAMSQPFSPPSPPILDNYPFAKTSSENPTNFVPTLTPLIPNSIPAISPIAAPVTTPITTPVINEAPFMDKSYLPFSVPGELRNDAPHSLLNDPGISSLPTMGLSKIPTNDIRNSHSARDLQQKINRSEETTRGGISQIIDLTINKINDNIEKVDPCIKNYIAGHAEQFAIETALEAAALRTANPGIIIGTSIGITAAEIITSGDDLLEFAQCVGELKEDGNNNE